ncbi:YibE/F family protein [Elusimicrobiota bacterium]
MTKKIKKAAFFFLFASFSLPALSSAAIGTSIEYVKAKVLKAHNHVPVGKQGIQDLTVKVMGGGHKNQQLDVKNIYWREEGYNTRLNSNDLVVLRIAGINREPIEAQIMGHYRSRYIYLSGGVFLLLFLAVFGWKKIRILFSVAVNLFLFSIILFPLIKIGFQPLPLAVLIGSAAVIITIIIILGFSRKFVSAACGGIAGMIMAGILSLIFLDMMHLSGLFSRDSRMLLTASRHMADWNIWDLKGLIAAGIIVTCMGAVIDVAVTIASSCYQVSSERKRVTAQLLWQSGMRIGKDIIATMLNSLVLAFLGISLPLIAVFDVMGIPFLRIINFEVFSIIIASALISSISFIVTVPATAFISCRLFRKI